MNGMTILFFLVALVFLSDIGTEVNVTTDTVISVHDMPTQILAVAQGIVPFS